MKNNQVTNKLVQSDTQLQVVEVNVNDLLPFPNNPRTWSRTDEEQLTESIKQFGTVVPLLVNSAQNRKNIVIGGNFRLEMYKKLKIEKAPVTYICIEDETKERELNLRLNRNQGTWDWDLLKEFNIDELINVGFDEVDLGKFWDNELGVEDDHFDLEEALEEVRKNPIAQLGDHFQLGNHKVICDDCLDPLTVQSIAHKIQVSYINCDPPYNIGLNYSTGIGNASSYGGQEKDKRTDADYAQFLKTSIQNALLVASPDAHIFYWCDETKVGLLQGLYKELNVNNKRLCIWVKNNQNVTPAIAFNKVIECCVYGTRGKPYINTAIRNLNEIQNKEITTGNRSADDLYDLFNIWFVDRLPSSEYMHPTMKPPTLYEKALRRCTKVGDYVLDLFGGSGSQLIACEQLKRRALLIEIDPVFVDLILLRYEQFTGIKPKKLN